MPIKTLWLSAPASLTVSLCVCLIMHQVCTCLCLIRHVCPRVLCVSMCVSAWRVSAAVFLFLLLFAFSLFLCVSVRVPVFPCLECLHHALWRCFSLSLLNLCVFLCFFVSYRYSNIDIDTHIRPQKFSHWQTQRNTHTHIETYTKDAHRLGNRLRGTDRRTQKTH